MRDAFVPGAYWTPDRIAEARRRANETMATPAYQAIFSSSEPPAFDTPPDGAVTLPMPVARERCIIRRGRRNDIPRMAALIAGANLPPLFLEEFIDGFAAVEYAGTVVGCGGVEMYGRNGVIRSVVVDERARGLGLGRAIAELLMADAVAAGAANLYLFTADAHDFWLAFGFRDVTLDAWEPEARENWQYRFISTHPEMLDGGVHAMWKRA